MSNYSRGADFERRVKRELEEVGWFVVRMAGSHSVADLVALRRAPMSGCQAAMIQCKISGHISNIEANNLFSAARAVGAAAILAVRFKRKIVLQQIPRTRIPHERGKVWDASWMLDRHLPHP